MITRYWVIMNIYEYSEREQIMNLLKNHANYLLDLVTRDLEVNRKLPTELRNFRWEIKLEDIINTLEQDVRYERDLEVKREYVLGEWVVKET